MTDSVITEFVDTVWEELTMFAGCPEEGPGKVETAWCMLLRNFTEQDLQELGSSTQELTNNFMSWHANPTKELEDWVIKLYDKVTQR